MNSFHSNQSPVTTCYLSLAQEDGVLWLWAQDTDLDEKWLKLATAADCYFGRLNEQGYHLF